MRVALVKFVSSFCASAAAGVLFVTGLVKLVSVFGNAGILTVPDPVFGIPFRIVMIFVGVLELVAAVMLFGRNRLFASALALCLGMEFLIYHHFAQALRPGTYCPCLGSLGQSLQLDQPTATRLALWIAGFIIVLSAVSFISAWLAQRSAGPPARTRT